VNTWKKCEYPLKEIPNQDCVLICYEYVDTKKRFIEIGPLSEYTPKYYFEGFYPVSDKKQMFRKMVYWMYLPELPMEEM